MTRVESTKYQSLSDGVSVIIPAFNAEQWVEETVKKIDNALINAKLKKAEIIIVDDGSTDQTRQIAETIRASVLVKVISHDNEGRYLARKRGVKASQYETVLFIDTRVWIDEKSISYLAAQQKDHPERAVWNGDVQVYKKGNMIARFGDAITRIGWRRYHAHPRLLSYGIEEFDYYPKGTGIFMLPRPLLLEAMEWFETQTKDIKYSSDDTLLIRYVAQHERIWISPGFTSVYFARTTLRQFINHSYYRGIFFVDGFLRPGTRFFYPLLAFIALTILTIAAMVVFPFIILHIILALMAVWILEFITALFLGLNGKDAGSLFILTPVFTIIYGIGIFRAVLKRLIKV